MSKKTKLELTPKTRWRWMWSKIEPNLSKLRKPQYNALVNVEDRLNPDHEEDYRLEKGGKPKIISMGTGVGKSISILINSIYLCAKIEEENSNNHISKTIRFLVVCPNVNIRTNNFEAVEDAFEYGIIPKEVKEELKITKAQLSEPSIVEDCDGTISTYQNLGKVGKGRLMEKIIDNVKGKDTAESCATSKFFDVVSVDEAHHYNENSDNIDTTHIEILNEFELSFKLLYTATPYQALVKKNKDGTFFLPPIIEDFDFNNDIIYDYNFRHAYEDGYVKFPDIIKCPSKDQVITLKNGGRIAEKINLTSKDMIERFKEKYGYRYLSALSNSPEVWGWLLGATVNTLDTSKHLPQHNCALVMFAQNKYADNGYNLYKEMFEKKGYRATVIHGDIPEKERKIRIQEMKNDKYDVVFSCQMFNEGFNYPNFNIVTYCRNVSSILLFSQTFGRAVRVRKDRAGKYINTKKAGEDIVDVAYVITHELSNISEQLWDMFNTLEWADIQGGKDRRKKPSPSDCQHLWESYNEDNIICIKCGTIKKKGLFMEIVSDHLDTINISGGLGEKSMHIKNKAIKDLQTINEVLVQNKKPPIELDEGVVNGYYTYKDGEVTGEYTEKIIRIVDRKTITREIEIKEESKSIDPEDIIKNNVKNLQDVLWTHVKKFRYYEKLPYDRILMKREMFKLFRSVYGFNLKTNINTVDRKKKERHLNFCKNDLPHLVKEFSNYKQFNRVFGGRLKHKLSSMGEEALIPSQENIKNVEDYLEDDK